MNKILKYLICLLWFVYVQSYGQGFTEVSDYAGIHHAFKIDLANFGGGVAVFDYDNDGFEDLYLPGGNDKDQLYKNNGDGTFANTFEGSGLDALNLVHTQGAAAADIDRDGDKDLLVTTLYEIENRDLVHNFLFRNDGNGKFTDVSREYGLTKYTSNSQGVSFGDINADGFPDMYIANYVTASPRGVSIFNQSTFTSSFISAPDYLFINSGGSYFIEASKVYGMDHRGFGFMGILSDWDNDQDLDVYVANDFGYIAQPNQALRNTYPERGFEYDTEDVRLNYGMNAMGIARTDFNMDGWMDYYVSNINAGLFVANEEGENFIDFGVQAGFGISLIDREDYQGVPVSWGANFFDYDHDGDEDLFVCNGALNPTVRPNHNFFFKNNDSQFEEISASLGVDDPRIARGSAVFDYDNDGDMDLIVVNQFAREPTQQIPAARTLLFRNDASEGNWLKVKLKGVTASPDGIGSRVEIKNGSQTMIREVDGGSSHLSQGSTILHFGLGDTEVVESITVKWLGGKVQELTNVDVNQTLTIEEDQIETPIFDSDELRLSPNKATLGSSVIIEYTLANPGPMQLDLYNINGQFIQNITTQQNPAQQGFWQWNVDRELAAGYHLITMTTQSGRQTIRVLTL